MGNFKVHSLGSILQLKIMVLVNASLGLLYVISSYWIWTELDKWAKWNIAANWNPLSIIPYHIPNTPQIQMPISPLYNLPFIIVCLMLVINLYFVFQLQRSKETRTDA